VKSFISQRPKIAVIAFMLAIYLIALAAFAFFPRPVLVSGSPAALANFLQTHANIFYRILYANDRAIAIANFFMLTPLPIIIHFLNPQLKKRYIFALGVLISGVIEISQLFIPGRVSDFRDVLSNACSVLVGIGCVRLLQKKSQQRH